MTKALICKECRSEALLVEDEAKVHQVYEFLYLAAQRCAIWDITTFLPFIIHVRYTACDLNPLTSNTNEAVHPHLHFSIPVAPPGHTTYVYQPERCSVYFYSDKLSRSNR